jgi:hypothetical protein
VAFAALNSESVILTQVRLELEPRNSFQFWPFFPVDRGNEKPAGWRVFGEAKTA